MSGLPLLLQTVTVLATPPKPKIFFLKSIALFFSIIPFAFNQPTLSVVNVRKPVTDLFPVGFYTEGFTGLARHKQVIDDLARGGFNVMYLEGDVLTNTEYINLLNYSNLKGIKNIIGLRPRGRNDAFVNQFKTYNSIIGWSIGDDAELLYTKAELTQNQTATKAADVNHFTFSAPSPDLITNVTKLKDFTSITDVAAMQWYPIYNSSTNGNEIYFAMSKFDDMAALNRKPSWASLQTYKWGGTGNKFPSPDQITNMTYSSLNAGITGILYYTLRDYRATLPNQPENLSINNTQPKIWATAKRIAAEINGTNGLKDVLQKGKITKLTGTDNVSNADVSVSYWTYSGFTYVIVTSMNESADSPVTITLPAKATGKVTTMFSYPATLTKSGNTLSGTVNAKSVQIFKIKNS